MHKHSLQTHSRHWKYWILIDHLTSGPRFNIKMTSYQYRKSHCGDKTVVRSSYLHNGISYTGKMALLYWFSPQTNPPMTSMIITAAWFHAIHWKVFHQLGACILFLSFYTKKLFFYIVKLPADVLSNRHNIVEIVVDIVYTLPMRNH